MNEIQRVFGYNFKGNRYDVGEKLGFIKTTIDFAVKNAELKEDLLVYLEEKLKAVN